MAESLDQADVRHTGQHTFENVVLRGKPVGDAQCNTSDPIGTDKLYHQYMPVFSQDNGTAVATKRRVVYVARSAGSLKAFRAGLTTANVGGATVAVDLYKNGATVLTAPISIAAGDGTTTKNGSVDPTKADYVAGDKFEEVVTATLGGGTQGQGLFTQPVFNELS